MHRRAWLIGTLAALVVRVPLVAAAAERDFDPKAFRAAQEAWQGIVVQVHAHW